MIEFLNDNINSIPIFGLGLLGVMLDIVSARLSHMDTAP